MRGPGRCGRAPTFIHYSGLKTTCHITYGGGLRGGLGDGRTRGVEREERRDKAVILKKNNNNEKERVRERQRARERNDIESAMILPKKTSKITSVSSLFELV